MRVAWDDMNQYCSWLNLPVDLGIEAEVQRTEDSGWLAMINDNPRDHVVVDRDEAKRLVEERLRVYTTRLVEALGGTVTWETKVD